MTTPRSYCGHGHRMTPANTQVIASKRGPIRRCRRCRRAREAALRKEKAKVRHDDRDQADRMRTLELQLLEDARDAALAWEKPAIQARMDALASRSIPAPSGCAPPAP